MIGDELKQEDILTVRKRKQLTVAKEVEKINTLDSNIPIGFIPVKFSSKDKFCPSVLHFRNYAMNEIYDITSTAEDRQTRTIVTKVLNPMCYEKFDCSDLPFELIQEIMLTVYANFWGNSLTNRPYYIDSDSPDKDKKENIGYVDIPINKIHTFDINPNFSNKFSIDYKNTKATFCVPIMRHVFIAEDYVRDIFSEREQKFIQLKSKLASKEYLESKDKFDESSKIVINEAEKEAYDDLMTEKGTTYLKVLQYQSLLSLNGKELETLDDKLNVLNNNDIDIDFWGIYNQVLSDNKFGIDDQYTFSKDDKSITRRFSFRLVDLLPSMEQKKYTGYVVHFNE
jgi:hypothetical protein